MLAITPYSFALIIAVNTASAAVAVLIATWEYPRPMSSAFQIFGWGKLLGAAGYLILSLRPELPTVISTVIANTCIVYGFFTTYWAVRQIQGKPTSAWHSLSVIGSCLAFCAYWSFVQPSQPALRVISSLYGLYISGLMVWELLFRYRGHGRAHIVAGVTTVVLGGLMILRAMLAASEHTIAQVNTLSGDWAEMAFFILAIVAGTTGAVNFMLVSNDILNGELRQLVHLDPLTCIANRRRLFERGQEEMRRSRRFRHPLALLVFDLDHFKRINDTWGHATGDEALKTVAARSLGVIRKIDTIARLGGEEFAVLLPETNCAMALEVAERLRVTIAESVLICTKADGAVTTPLWITVSIGVAMLEDQDSFSILLDHADQAMYRAKRDGRNRVVLHTALPVGTMANVRDRLGTETAAAVPEIGPSPI